MIVFFWRCTQVSTSMLVPGLVAGVRFPIADSLLAACTTMIAIHPRAPQVRRLEAPSV
jgi:hypothetical protein